MRALSVRPGLLAGSRVAEVKLQLVLENRQDVLRVLDAEAACLFAVETKGFDETFRSTFAFGDATAGAADDFSFGEGLAETYVHWRLLQTFSVG